MTEAYVCAGLRSPFGRYGGALAGIRPDDLAAQVIAALLRHIPQVAGSEIDEIILGCANQAGEDNRNVARMAGLLAGLPETVPGVTVNRLCSSGAEAIGQAARAIRCGEADLIIAGGVESMTRAPFVVGKAIRPWSRDIALEDTTMGWRFVNPAMQSAYGVETMPQTAENVAREFGISREAQDRFALASQIKAERARAAGRYEAEIVPVTIEERSGVRLVSEDEHPRPGTTLEALARLPGVVTREGSVTAGNASGINDGAAVVLVASEAAIRRHGLTPMARIAGMTSVGVLPRIMGIGPVAATRRLLGLLRWEASTIDLLEINEAFAAQVLACLLELGLDPESEWINPHGGAIALGHPLGASGARLALSSSRDLADGKAKRALVTMCVGVGQGTALALEAV